MVLARRRSVELETAASDGSKATRVQDKLRQ
jgi:hypothetical protein